MRAARSRVESKVLALAGSVDARTPTKDPDAPLLTLEAMALFGGIAVVAKADDGAARP